MRIGGRVVLEPAYGTGEPHTLAPSDHGADAGGVALDRESLALVSDDGFGKRTEITWHAIPPGPGLGLRHPDERIVPEHGREE